MRPSPNDPSPAGIEAFAARATVPPAPPPTRSPTIDDQRPDPARLQAILADQTAALGRGHVGIVAGVVAGGVRSVREYGMVGRPGRPLDGRTLFPLGALDRVLVGLLLGDAVANDALDPDRPASDLVEELGQRPRRRPPTLAELALHRSGLEVRRRPPWGRRLAASDALRRRPPRPPGGRIRVSRLGTEALATALVRHHGASLEEVLQRRLAASVPLPDIVSTLDEDQQGRRAQGHSRRQRPVEERSGRGLPVTGGLHGTADDLLALVATHLDPPEPGLARAVTAATTPRTRDGTADPDRGDESYGWHVLTRRNGQRWWWQNAVLDGFASFVAFVPEADAGAVVLANSARPVELLGMTLLARTVG